MEQKLWSKNYGAKIMEQKLWSKNSEKKIFDTNLLYKKIFFFTGKRSLARERTVHTGYRR